MQRRRAEQEAARKAREAEAPAPEAKPEEPKRTWLSFRAHLTIDDARALKEFFLSRHVAYEQI